MKKLLIIILMHSCAFSFETIQDIQTFALKNTEFPKSDSENWAHPDFSSLYKPQEKTIFTRIKELFSFQKRSSWSMDNFEHILKRVTLSREAQNLPKDALASLRAVPGTQLYIWADLHGNYHSLARSLQWLKQEHVIDENLKIVDQNTYFVFTGYILDRSAYGLELLEIILLLMERNPNKIFYLQGALERSGNWQNYALAQEANYITSTIAQEKSVNELLENFFNTLPIALYLVAPANPKELIGIFTNNAQVIDISEADYASLFSNKEPIAYQSITQTSKTPDWNILLKTIIQNENSIKVKNNSTGLGRIEQQKGAVTLGITSAPLIKDQKYHEFFYDAFARIEIKNSFKESTITLFNRDARTKQDGFSKGQPLNLLTGTVNGKTFSDIMLGSTMTLELGVPRQGQLTSRGLLTRIAQANEENELENYILKALILNDDYVPVTARENIMELIKRNIKTVILPVGTPTLSNYLDLVTEGKIAVLFPVTGATAFRKPTIKNIVHFRASFDDEVRALIKYMIDQYGTKKFAFFYQDDAFGQGALSIAHEELKARGITQWTDIPYTRGTTDFQAQADKIAQHEPEALGLFAVGSSAQEFLRRVGASRLSHIKLFSLSDATEASFKDFFTRRGYEIIISSVVPNPNDSDLEIVKEYQQTMKLFNYPNETFSLEAYIGTSLLIDVLKKIKGEITNEKIMNEFEKMKDYTYKGLHLSFDPQTRSLHKSVWIAPAAVNQKWIMA